MVHHFDAGIIENLAHKPASQASGVVAVSGNGGQEFAEHVFGGDQQSIRTICGTGGGGPGIVWDEDCEPINRVGKESASPFRRSIDVVVDLAGEVLRYLPQFFSGDHAAKALRDPHDPWRFVGRSRRPAAGRYGALCFSGRACHSNSSIPRWPIDLLARETCTHGQATPPGNTTGSHSQFWTDTYLTHFT